jgi:hypothetical protein
MRKIKWVIKWSCILGILYFVLTTLYFGYDDIDSEKGIYKFYWSGLRGLWEERPFGFKVNKIVETNLDGVDGPYVFGDSVFHVDKKSVFHGQRLDTSRKVTVKTFCEQLSAFSIILKDSIQVESDSYEKPEKLIAISDIEGNFTAFFSFLYSNGVIGKNGNWVFGNGHLVLNGDFVDRGNQVTQVLWLIYRLESEAEEQSGKVHFILGNHEIMNMYGDVSYNNFKYIEVAKRISQQTDWDKGLRYLYSEKSELGRWLRSKNIVEKIGDNIFVHGGLNTFHLRGKYSIAELNTISRNYNGIWPAEEKVKNKRDRPVLSATNSPFWDRRLNLDWKYKIMFTLYGIDAKATTQNELDSILNFFRASRLVIGHCVVNDITTSYQNKVISIDVKHGRKINSGKTKGLFIEGDNYFKISDEGDKTQLFY